MTSYHRRKVIRREEDVKARNRVRAAFVALFVVTGIALSIIGYFVNENRHRTDEIQAARLESCKRTYEGIREVFTPFFPVDENGQPKPGATLKQLEDYGIFNDEIDRLIAQCQQQTRVTDEEASNVP